MTTRLTPNTNTSPSTCARRPVGLRRFADDVRRDYGRLATIVVEEFPPSPEREALLERLAEREALALIAVGALRTH